jgi:hypothetical protein
MGPEGRPFDGTWFIKSNGTQMTHDPPYKLDCNDSIVFDVTGYDGNRHKERVGGFGGAVRYSPDLGKFVSFIEHHSEHVGWPVGPGVFMTYDFDDLNGLSDVVGHRISNNATIFHPSDATNSDLTYTTWKPEALGICRGHMYVGTESRYDGRIIVTDPYGNYIDDLALPDKFNIDPIDSRYEDRVEAKTKGMLRYRQIQGIDCTPDEKHLVVIAQWGLCQDTGCSLKTAQPSPENNHMLRVLFYEWDPDKSWWKTDPVEKVYPASLWIGVMDLLMIDSDRAYIIESTTEFAGSGFADGRDRNINKLIIADFKDADDVKDCNSLKGDDGGDCCIRDPVSKEPYPGHLCNDATLDDHFAAQTRIVTESVFRDWVGKNEDDANRYEYQIDGLTWADDSRTSFYMVTDDDNVGPTLPKATARGFDVYNTTNERVGEMTFALLGPEQSSFFSMEARFKGINGNSWTSNGMLDMVLGGVFKGLDDNENRCELNLRMDAPRGTYAFSGECNDERITGKKIGPYTDY